MLPTVLPVLNAIAAAISTASSLLVVFRPHMMSKSREVSAGERFFAQMYAARAVPLGVITAVAPFTVASDISTVRLILMAAMTVQVIDVGIGIRRRETAMIIGPSIAAVIHGATAWFA
ncbi:hypothetical protein [Actinomyces sp. ZJ308]|uniref:hypothetical protein n=1 Tax=Actinomyces sp. ZJ308 TaxID=2708342 RepID=UPI001FB8F6B5|nr:hypothetical protein [Actinomyces sp. ZJ308]